MAANVLQITQKSSGTVCRWREKGHASVWRMANACCVRDAHRSPNATTSAEIIKWSELRHLVCRYAVCASMLNYFGASIVLFLEQIIYLCGLPSTHALPSVRLRKIISLFHGKWLCAVNWNKVIAINRKTNLTQSFCSKTVDRQIEREEFVPVPNRIHRRVPFSLSMQKLFFEFILFLCLPMYSSVLLPGRACAAVCWVLPVLCL